MVFRLVLLAAVLCVTQAFLFGGGDKWDGLRVTWGPNPLSKTYFARLPRTARDACKAGFTQISCCGVTWGPNPLSSTYFASLPRTVHDAGRAGFKRISGCSSSSSFRGERYMKGGDHAVILIFDKQGTIAGIQAGIKQTPNYPSKYIMPPFIAEGGYNYITAYFVEPSSICSSGRSSSRFASEGTGTMLSLQNGPNPEKDLIRMPAKESSLASTKWTKGKCFPTMGVHYWYNLSTNMNCDNFFPVFLLYNKGKLNAFGWAFQAGLTSSRYEHPTQSVFSAFMKQVPTCLKSAGTLSTQHIYLTDHPALDLC